MESIDSSDPSRYTAGGRYPGGCHDGRGSEGQEGVVRRVAGRGSGSAPVVRKRARGGGGGGGPAGDRATHGEPATASPGVAATAGDEAGSEEADREGQAEGGPGMTPDRRIGAEALPPPKTGIGVLHPERTVRAWVNTTAFRLSPAEARELAA